MGNNFKTGIKTKIAFLLLLSPLIYTVQLITFSLIAALLGMKFKKAFPAVIIGIFMATVIMWFISYVLLGGVAILA